MAGGTASRRTDQRGGRFTPRSTCWRVCWSTSERGGACPGGLVPEVTAARLRGQEYLLERRMHRRRSTGAVIDHDRKTDRPVAWMQFSYPTYWHYDVLPALD